MELKKNIRAFLEKHMKHKGQVKPKIRVNEKNINIIKNKSEETYEGKSTKKRDEGQLGDIENALAVSSNIHALIYLKSENNWIRICIRLIIRNISLFSKLTLYYF